MKRKMTEKLRTKDKKGIKEWMNEWKKKDIGK